MDKGIRAYAGNYFVEQNELRRRGEVFTGPKANTVFRKQVMAKLMEEFGISLASAATHYNEAFKTVRSCTPELVSGLGRPEDKKGGRKPRPVNQQPVAECTEVDTTAGDAACAAGALAAAPCLLLGWAGVVGLEDDAPF
jgi:hypothetical protein